MTHVFASHPIGWRPAEKPHLVRAKVLNALSHGGWVSTGELYDATLRKVRRTVMHQVLKDLLADRTIRMRVLRTDGRDRTEFRLVRH